MVFFTFERSEKAKIALLLFMKIFTMLQIMPEVYFAIIALEVIAIIVAVALYTLEYRKDKNLREQKELPILNELREKNADILERAVEESQHIVSEAEAEGLKITKDTNEKAKELEYGLTEAFTSLRSGVEQTLEKQTQAALDSFTTYLKTLEEKSNDSQTTVENIAKAKVNEFIEKFEQNLSDFLVSSQQKSLSAIELELTSARNLIETYKEKQIRIVNENIMAMLEKTLSLVLTRKLTLKDHMDLIYESLEKAKEEKFIG